MASVHHPACLVTDIFILMGNISGRGWGRRRAGRRGRRYEPERRRRWGRGAEGRTRDGGRANRDKAGSERGVAEATETTMMEASGRRITTEDLPVRTQDDSAGRKYRVGGTGMEESAAENADLSG